jgi:hypothetical protein
MLEELEKAAPTPNPMENKEVAKPTSAKPTKTVTKKPAKS